jgi:hypothetical protein
MLEYMQVLGFADLGEYDSWNLNVAKDDSKKKGKAWVHQ